MIRRAAMAATVLALAACVAGRPMPVPDAGDVFGTAVVYDCGGERFAVAPEQEAVRLFLPDGAVRLPRVVAASGAKYGDGATVFWSKSDEALLELDGRSHRGCRIDPAATVWEAAALRGIDFRAIGQEPGWLLEIDEGERIVAVTDYGETRTIMPAPTPVTSPGRTVYRAETEAHALLVTIEDAPCQDVMSGAAFPATVTIRLDGRPYRGCGRFLR